MSDLFTLEQVRARLSEVAQAHPEHIGVTKQGDCVYFANNAPSCIVGHAFEAELRQSAYDVYALEGEVSDLVFEGYLPMTEAAMVYARTVQTFQDDRQPWGDAIRAADQHSYATYDDTDLPS